jgi:ABC-type amino acid transport system permease subunit
VQIARGVPPYVFLLWVHFGLAALIDVAFTPLQSIILVLAITGGGYTAEIFRSGIIAVEPGQVEAARSLGMTRIRVYGDVILPQALRIIVPPLGNIWIGLLKTATLMGVIAVPDLLYYAQSINMNYFAPFEAFSAVVVIFVSIVFCVSLFVAGLEKALSHP